MPDCPVLHLALFVMPDEALDIGLCDGADRSLGFEECTMKALRSCSRVCGRRSDVWPVPKEFGSTKLAFS